MPQIEGMALAPGTPVTAAQLAAMIDHALLRPELPAAQVAAGCRTADAYGCASVCVKPCDVSLAAELLINSAVEVGTVIGFPHGSNLTEVKLRESELAIRQGATELDMVLNIGRLKGGDLAAVEDDIRRVCRFAHDCNATVKVILENAFLTNEEKVAACRVSEAAGADFVKTSTGFAATGATVADLILMRRSVGDKVQVKAAGGIRTLDQALMVRAVGASRFGASATREIVEEAKAREAAGTLKIPDALLDF